MLFSPTSARTAARPHETISCTRTYIRTSKAWRKWTASRGSTFISTKWDGIQQGTLTYSRVPVLTCRHGGGQRLSSTHPSSPHPLSPPLHWVSRSQGPHVITPLDGCGKIFESLSAKDSQVQVEWHEEDSPAITTSGWSVSY